MGCCSPFTATASATAADPARHVNFTAGMVLGVDDYAQEFAYHSARDKWIVRDFLGYGTLSGLAVSVEDEGTGPRIRVTPGSAAAPSGQLICVGREQCGGLNAWLARAEVKTHLDELVAEQADKTKASLNLFLTLCYKDCAVAEVPIPGEPCRSDENLMAPSRIADDYVLSFAWEPPPMAEALAGDALDVVLGRVSSLPANPSTEAALAAAIRMGEIQLQVALGVYPPDSPAPNANDLKPILVNPAFEARFRAALKRFWVTRLRPLVAAQRCGIAPVAANDCVLLAQLWLPVANAGTDWFVDGKAEKVIVNESTRPVLLSARFTQTGFGQAMIPEAPTGTFQLLTANGTISGKARIAIVRSDAATQIKVPSAKNNPGTELTVKAGGNGEVKLVMPAADISIDGRPEYTLPPRTAVHLVSDGADTWHVTGIVA